jgi:hypothetical protein
MNLEPQARKEVNSSYIHEVLLANINLICAHDDASKSSRLGLLVWYK